MQQPYFTNITFQFSGTSLQDLSETLKGTAEQSMNKRELTKEIYQTYEELFEKTNELLDLLKVYLAPGLYEYVRQQADIRLKVTKEVIEEAQTKSEYLSVYVQDL